MKLSAIEAMKVKRPASPAIADSFQEAKEVEEGSKFRYSTAASCLFDYVLTTMSPVTPDPSNSHNGFTFYSVEAFGGAEAFLDFNRMSEC